MHTVRRIFTRFSRIKTIYKSTKKFSPSIPISIASLNHINHIRFIQSQPQNTNEISNPRKSLLDKLVSIGGPDTIMSSSPDTFNRWLLVSYAVTTHLCLGACYAWSIFNEPLTRGQGVLMSASNDWTIANVPYTFTGLIVGQGAAMATFGKVIDRLGPRLSGVIGASLYGGGMCLGALGVNIHNFSLLLGGYGILAGIGMGIAYLPPITTLMRWFPDKPGMASAMAICGFGGGAILIAPLKKYFMAQNFKLPEYLGTVNDVKSTIDESGRRLVEINDKMKEVINITSENIEKLNLSNDLNIQEGLYLCGTGNTGVAATMAILATGYFSVVSLGALSVKLPPTGWKPESMRREEAKIQANEANTVINDDSSDEKVEKLVHVDDVMKLPQFWCQFVTFCCTATVGMGILSQAKDVLQACFIGSAAASGLILKLGGPAAFCLAYVQLMSFANLGGKFTWATLSDKIGPKNIFTLFSFIGGPLCLSLPYIVHSTAITDLSWPIYSFLFSTFFIISFSAGSYSTMPAYENSLYGLKYVGSIHGRLMLASALSGIMGPLIFNSLRYNQKIKSINQLLDNVDDNTFYEKYGVNIQNSNKVIDSGALTIDNLLTICPDGTIDPTPYLYDPAFKAMAIVFGIGGLTNLFIKRVDPKWFVANRIKNGAKYSDIKS